MIWHAYIYHTHLRNYLKSGWQSFGSKIKSKKSFWNTQEKQQGSYVIRSTQCIFYTQFIFLSHVDTLLGSSTLEEPRKNCPTPQTDNFHWIITILSMFYGVMFMFQLEKFLCRFAVVIFPLWKMPGGSAYLRLYDELVTRHKGTQFASLFIRPIDT